MNNMPTQKKRILLVEDDDELRLALTKLLHREGFDVEAHADGVSALNHLASDPGPYALAISDVSMPGIRGTKLLSLLKQKSPSLPVILITAFGDWGEYNQALCKGAFEYLCKPLDLNEFLFAVHQAVDPSSSYARVSPAWDPW